MRSLNAIVLALCLVAAACTTDDGEPVSVTTGPSSVAPQPDQIRTTLPQVTDLTATDGEITGRLEWSPVPGAVAYRIQATGSFTIGAELCTSASCSMGVDYWFTRDEDQVTVVAIDASGGQSPPAGVTIDIAPAPVSSDILLEVLAVRRDAPTEIELIPVESERDGRELIQRLEADRDYVGAAFNTPVTTLNATEHATETEESTWQTEAMGFDIIPGTGAGITIAIIDEGIDTSHPSLAGAAVIVEWDDGLGEPSFHGTAVASMIVGQPAGAVPGIAPDAELLSFDVVDPGVGGTRAQLIGAIDAAITADVDIINISMVTGCGFPANIGSCPEDLEDALDRAEEAGIVVVASAGNHGQPGCVDGRDANERTWPNAYGTTISVGGTGTDGFPWTCSVSNDDVDIFAPAQDLLVASYEADDETMIDGAAYVVASGTSYAGPLMAGLIARLLEIQPDLTPGHIRLLLKHHATDPGAIFDPETLLEALQDIEDGTWVLPDDEQALAEVRGDPHLTTFDGRRYSFMGVGEYLLATNGTIDIQARFVPLNDVASMTEAIAMTVDGSIVQIHADGRRFLDGQPVARFPASSGDVSITDGERITFSWPDGTVVTARFAFSEVAVTVRASPTIGAWEGLMGSPDRDPNNDLIGLNGAIEDVTYEALYLEMRPRWSTEASKSLFTYFGDETHESFFDESIPSKVFGLSDFADDVVESARVACFEAGVLIEPYNANCAYDFLVTDDERFIQVAASDFENLYPSVDLGELDEPSTVVADVVADGAGSVFYVRGQPGTRFSLDVLSAGGAERCGRAVVDFEVLVLADGEVLGADWIGNHGCRASGPWEFPRSGQAALLVRARQPQTSLLTTRLVPRQGTAELTIAPLADLVEEIELDVDEKAPLVGAIAAARDRVTYRLATEPGSVFTVDAFALDGVEQCGRGIWDAHLYAYDSAGELLSERWVGNAGCGALPPVTVPDDGIIGFVVEGGDTSVGPSTGSWSFELARIELERQSLDISQSPGRVTVETDRPLDGLEVTVTGRPGASLEIEALSMNGQEGCGRGEWNLHAIIFEGDSEIHDEWIGNRGCRIFGPWTFGRSGEFVVRFVGGGDVLFPLEGSASIELRQVSD